MKRFLVSAAAILIACWAVASGASAGCKEDAAPAVDWQGCSKQMLQLDHADLAGADLSGAYLSGSAFHEANLTGANLQRSELLRTSFLGANLTGANFEKALASRAVFEATAAQRRAPKESRIPTRELRYSRSDRRRHGRGRFRPQHLPQ